MRWCMMLNTHDVQGALLTPLTDLYSQLCGLVTVTNVLSGMNRGIGDASPHCHSVRKRKLGLQNAENGQLVTRGCSSKPKVCRHQTA